MYYLIENRLENSSWQNCRIQFFLLELKMQGRKQYLNCEWNFLQPNFWIFWGVKIMWKQWTSRVKTIWNRINKLRDTLLQVSYFIYPLFKILLCVKAHLVVELAYMCLLWMGNKYLANSTSRCFLIQWKC